MKRVRVLLAEDHAGVAEQLRGVLELEFEVVAIVGDGPGLVAAAEALRPDVIVTDIAMPGLDGIAAARAIRRADPGARIVFVTVHNDPALVRRGLAAGALGYVLKLAAGDDLLPAVHAVAQGQRYVSQGVTGGVP
jgi:DNA-binding NarL/FixJ family response regulator